MRHIAETLFPLIVQVVGQQLLLLPRIVFCHYDRQIPESLFHLIIQRDKNLFFCLNLSLVIIEDMLLNLYFFNCSSDGTETFFSSNYLSSQGFLIF